MAALGGLERRDGGDVGAQENGEDADNDSPPSLGQRFGSEAKMREVAMLMSRTTHPANSRMEKYRRR